MKTIQQWFVEYGESHKNPINKRIHWLCVPVIYWTVAALLYGLPLPFIGATPWLNAASLTMLAVTVFYARLSLSLALGMAIFSLLCLMLCAELVAADFWPLWQIALVVFVLAWIGQFIGHAIEGKRPSFMQDLQFLLIGPAWCLGFIYRRVGISL